jgi:hypothetical protein
MKVTFGGANQLRQTLEPSFLKLDSVIMEMKPGLLLLMSLIMSEVVSHIQRKADRIRQKYSGGGGDKTLTKTS